MKVNLPFPSYRGDEPYIFVCYSHRDATTVYTDLAELNNNGIKLWYDEGIPAGSSWRAEIAASIKGASKLLFFISESSLASNHCLREVDYALNHDVEIVPVYLDDVSLPGELELVFSRVHALMRTTDSLYMQHLLGALEGPQRFVPLQRAARRRNYSVPMLAVALALLLALAWTQRDAFMDDGGAATDADIAIAPSAFDRYLEGLQLMERWDKNDNLAMATESFREATALDPGFALAYARLAEAQRMRYALSGNETWLDEAANSANSAVQLNPGLAQVQVALGRVQWAQGNVDLAFAAIQRAVSIDPNDAIANQAIASMYSSLGRTDDAEASFKKAISLDPENLLILDGYANFLYEQSRFDDASKQWQAMVRLAPDHYAALVNLGASFNETGKTAEAISVFRRAIEIQPTYMAYTNLGTSYSRLGRYQEGIDALHEALQIDDSDWLAWGNLGFLYAWANGMDAQTIDTFNRAIELAEKARETSPRDPFVYSDLALYYAKLNQQEPALQRLGTAIALAPDSAEIQAAAAEVYELLGERDKAIERVQKSLKQGFSQQQLRRNPEFAELLNDPRLQLD